MRLCEICNTDHRGTGMCSSEYSAPNIWSDDVTRPILPKIIGISGRKRHGKDTFADILTQLLLPHTSAKLGFATALKQEVAFASGVSTEYVEEHKENFRLILQGWGTDYRRNLCGNNYWIDRFKTLLYAQYSHLDFVFVPDVRFKNELACIKELGGTTVRVVRPSLKDLDNHISETELDGESFDFVTYANNKEQLEVAVKHFVVSQQLSL